MSRAFNISWRISSTPAGLLLRNFLTTSETFARDMGEATTESSNSASSKENMLVWFRSSSKCSFYHSTISPVRVSIFPNITDSVLVNMSLGPGHLILHHQLKGCRQCVTQDIMLALEKADLNVTDVWRESSGGPTLCEKEWWMFMSCNSIIIYKPVLFGMHW